MNQNSERCSTEPRHAKPVRLAAMLAWAMGGLAVLLVAVSCSTSQRTIVAPPEIAGAQFVGSENCAQCHEAIVRDFITADHARLRVRGDQVQDQSCESCHGPGSLHAESGGTRGTIVNPRKSSDSCFQCHLDKRGQFGLPHHHPIEEGKVSCGDCHHPHKGRALEGTATSLRGNNETCLRCHPSQRGPFVFEHEAVREGCTTCHEPHGSINAKMLTERNANLCLKCHFQQQTAPGRIFIGGRDHSAFLSRGTCWTAGCHEAVHGSHIGSSLRF